MNDNPVLALLHADEPIPDSFRPEFEKTRAAQQKLDGIVDTRDNSKMFTFLAVGLAVTSLALEFFFGRPGEEPQLPFYVFLIGGAIFAVLYLVRWGFAASTFRRLDGDATAAVAVVHTECVERGLTAHWGQEWQPAPAPADGLAVAEPGA